MHIYQSHTVKTSTDMAAASPSKEREFAAKAPIISATTNIKNVMADTHRIVRLLTSIPQNESTASKLFRRGAFVYPVSSSISFGVPSGALNGSTGN